MSRVSSKTYLKAGIGALFVAAACLYEGVDRQSDYEEFRSDALVNYKRVCADYYDRNHALILQANPGKGYDDFEVFLKDCRQAVHASSSDSWVSGVWFDISRFSLVMSALAFVAAGMATRCNAPENSEP
ncbi:MAG: hypothetical protein KDI13_02265 [Alphaproteobacteria bacterium]|nr:hypothetical protein [Alphaproteobacteria bacterium]